jgi:hypothetical protein
MKVAAEKATDDARAFAATIERLERELSETADAKSRAEAQVSAATTTASLLLLLMLLLLL